MTGFNFGKIGKYIEKYMDTDLMSIGRRMQITNPNGTIGETDPEVPLYTNVPCHIAYNKADNPDPASVDTRPIIVGITIHCPVYVDIQNGDLVIANKMSHNGEIIESYPGIVGMPIVHQSRKEVQMEMRAHV